MTPWLGVIAAALIAAATALAVAAWLLADDASRPPSLRGVPDVEARTHLRLPYAS